MRAMRIFFDTEFTNLTPDAELISIGFVSEDGQEAYYAELAGWDETKVSDFTREVVLPLLDQPKNSRLTSAQCAAAVAHWLSQFNAEIELVSDSSWDWRLLCRLLGDYFRQQDEHSAILVTERDGDLSIHYQLFSLASAQEERIYLQAIKPLFRGREHHALVDARALRAGVLAVESISVSDR
jgi:hypothetical protein